ncbi:DUF3566 domain-containing protein [Corynebacterium doosanense]|uniref:DUF3566 domain-containing protein n=1 Tax=Corynebacterium doosanense TaxID=1121358 RepID=UPI0005703330|nr:DUF3566 domain-containing protein [Corynebacterium doosanense]
MTTSSASEGRFVNVRHVSPVSAFKIALAMSLIGLVAWIIAVAVLYFGMQVAGVWASVNELIGGVGGDQAITFGVVMALAALLGAIMSVLLSILAPLAAVIYNGVTDLFGGLEVVVQD